MGDRQVPAHPLTRAGLVLLALPSAVIAGWTLIAPRAFYDDFPGGGRHWVSALPPYNEHLLRDFGAASLAIVVFLIGAAIFLERRVIQLALVAFLAYSLPHFIHHRALLEQRQRREPGWLRGDDRARDRPSGPESQTYESFLSAAGLRAVSFPLFSLLTR